jgi:hypothetical protein
MLLLKVIIGNNSAIKAQEILRTTRHHQYISMTMMTNTCHHLAPLVSFCASPK